MAVDTAAALRKLTSGQTLTAEEKAALGAGSTAPKTVSTMSKDEIGAATAKVVATGGKSTDPTNRLPGETATQANERITAAYKELLAKPILNDEAKSAGATVQYVRVGAGGQGEYTVVVPIGYTGPSIRTTQWTEGIIPATGKYTTGTTLGVYSKGDGTYTTVGGTPPKTISTSNTGVKKTIVSIVTNADGSITITYSDGSKVTNPAVGGNNNGNNGNNGNGSNTDTEASTPTTNVEVLKSLLRAAGYNPSIIDSSATYLQQLLKDGLDYDNAVEVFLNSKEYTLKNGTKVTSPFYTTYGFLNESAPKPLSASELYGFVEGNKLLVSKYNLNQKFASADSLKKYIKNQVTIEDLEGRANYARLKALEADPAYVEAMKKLGFINDASGLTDFFLDPEIGQETLEQNKRTILFASEAVRRAGAGIVFDESQKNLARQLAAGSELTGTAIQAYAAEGYANIAETLIPMTKLAGIYERGSDLKQSQIQSELEKEEFLGTASERRKRYKAQETASFLGAAGTNQYSFRGVGTAGII